MGWTKGKPRKVVGSEKRSDAEPAPVQQTWKTDQVEGQDPEFALQYMRENEVHDRSQPTRVFNRVAREWQYVPGWTVCTTDSDPNMRQLGQRPDLAAPVDSVRRMGPHVLMKIPKAAHALLEHEKDAVADAMQVRLMRGGYEGQGTYDGVATVVNKGIVPHPALVGEDEHGGKKLDRKESQLQDRLGS